MNVNIDENLKKFLFERRPEARYASFDYCFNYFQEARDAEKTSALADEDCLMLSCLQLGFYLASWGMMRGSGDLLYQSARALTPVVEVIAAEPKDVWSLGAGNLIKQSADVLELADRIRKSFGFNASDTLVTKTMLGVFGTVPALDRYFRMGFECSTLCKSALVRIGRYYADNRAVIDNHLVYTLDFTTGEVTERLYPPSKIIDMIYFQEGINLAARQKAKSARSA